MGWARDVSEAIATKVRNVAEHEGRELMSGTLHLSRPTSNAWSSRPCLCGEESQMATNFYRLGTGRPEFSRLLVAMLQARDALTGGSGSHPLDQMSGLR